jgi:hypothetical protein
MFVVLYQCFIQIFYFRRNARRHGHISIIYIVIVLLYGSVATHGHSPSSSRGQAQQLGEDITPVPKTNVAKPLEGRVRKQYRRLY